VALSNFTLKFCELLAANFVHVMHEFNELLGILGFCKSLPGDDLESLASLCVELAVKF